MDVLCDRLIARDWSMLLEASHTLQSRLNEILAELKSQPGDIPASLVEFGNSANPCMPEFELGDRLRDAINNFIGESNRFLGFIDELHGVYDDNAPAWTEPFQDIPFVLEMLDVGPRSFAAQVVSDLSVVASRLSRVVDRASKRQEPETTIAQVDLESGPTSEKRARFLLEEVSKIRRMLLYHKAMHGLGGSKIQKNILEYLWNAPNEEFIEFQEFCTFCDTLEPDQMENTLGKHLNCIEKTLRPLGLSLDRQKKNKRNNTEPAVRLRFDD